MGSTSRRSFGRLAVIAGIAASAGAFARGHDGRGPDHAARPARADRAPLAVVPNGAAPGEPAHGWRYFSDAGRRAVVVSPEGVYYLSRGKGLRPVAGTGPAA